MSLQLSDSSRFLKLFGAVIDLTKWVWKGRRHFYSLNVLNQNGRQNNQ